MSFWLVAFFAGFAIALPASAAENAASYPSRPIRVAANIKIDN
jgi:hypothetical protein